MPVFKSVFKIAKKQIGPSLIYIGIFILLVNVISNLNAKDSEDYVDKECKIAVFDNDNSEESKRLTEYLGSIHKIKDIEDDKKEILDSMYLQNIDYVLYINEGYSENGTLTNVKRPGSSDGMYIDNQIKSYETSIKALMVAGYSIDEAFDKTMESYEADELVNMQEEKSTKKPLSYYIFLYIPYAGAMAIFQVIAAILVAVNRKEISDRTTVSSVSIRSRNLQVSLAVIILSTIIWFIFAMIGIGYEGIDIFTSKIGLNLLNSFINILVVVGIVYIVGNFNVTAQAVSMIANIYALGSCFLGGIFVPMEFFGESLMNIARFMPTYWYVQAEQAIYAGDDISKVFGYMGVQVIFAAVFFTVALVVSRKTKLGRTA